MDTWSLWNNFRPGSTDTVFAVLCCAPFNSHAKDSKPGPCTIVVAASKRRKQLDAAEKLYAIIDSEKEYPFEFVFFRIIGFSHKGPVAQPLVKGEQLLEDLRLFITKLSVGLAAPVSAQSQKVYGTSELSVGLAAPVSAQSQKVYGTSELAETLGVSARTIQRWRKRGLIARKFIFEDGVKRLGFFQSTVDKFLARQIPGPQFRPRGPRKELHADNAEAEDPHDKACGDPCVQGKALATREQKTRMIRRAATLASKAKLSRHAIVSKIAVEMGRSHETVRSTLVNYEKAHPHKHLFKRPPGIMDSALAAEIYKLFKPVQSQQEFHIPHHKGAKGEGLAAEED